MKGQCGKKSIFSPDLPCAVDHAPAEEVSERPKVLYLLLPLRPALTSITLQPSAKVRARLVAICGDTFAEGPLCCEPEQIEALATNLDQAEPLISSCPACRNNFRNFFCSFTCSPNQSQFLDVVETQQTDGQHGPAVKRVEYTVGDEFRQAFYDSCKDVKFGASNGFVMDLLGGGARDPDAFLKYLGDEKPLVGSPFQIDFPHPSSSVPDGSKNETLPPTPFNPPARGCGDADLLSRCACTDCPQVCTELPYVAPPMHGDTCRVGRFSCFTFALSLVYLVGLLLFLGGVHIGAVVGRRRKGRRGKSAVRDGDLDAAQGGPRRVGIRHRNSGISISSEASHEQVRLEHDAGSAEDESARGRSSTDAERRRGQSVGSSADEASSSAGTGGGHHNPLLNFAGEGSLNALRSVQPRSYALNSYLSNFFYKLGLRCASSPMITFIIALVFVAVANIGWQSFEVETNPVRLWVSPTSPSKLRKEFFDENFGPFYRTQQVFLIDESAQNYTRVEALKHGWTLEDNVKPVLNWERLQWWSEVEQAIREIKTERNGVTFQDVCFAPSGAGGPCVVQSLMGYFQDDLDGAGVDESNWQKRLDSCASTPAECLPPFSQPLKPNVILGGIPLDRKASEARATVTTWIVDNSLDAAKVARAAEWEKALELFLLDVSGVRPPADPAARHPLALRREQLGVRIILSTEISLEEEIANSSNTDTAIVILSYLIMLIYAASTLGGGGPRAAGSIEPSNAARSTQSAPSGRSARTGFASRLRSLFGGRAEGRGPIHLEEDGELGSGASRSSPARARLIDRLFVRSKFMLGLFGIVIVLLAISSAVGLFSAAGVKVTLIIAEVIPFLVLAVGVDNVFLLSHEMDRQNSLASTSNPFYSATLDRAAGNRARQQMGTRDYDEDADADFDAAMSRSSSAAAFHLSAAERAARALSRTGPSILLSATIQVTAFLLGALVPMPAVRNFALYAAGSMAIAAVMHCTVFVAALALDADRSESGRVDCVPCIQVRRPRVPEMASLGIGSSKVVTDSWLARFMREKYAPFLVKQRVKRVVLVVFAGILTLSLIFARKVEMGLDQRLALPPHSYLRNYFDAVDTWLEVGPPVYFVAEQADMLHRSGQQALCGRFTTCNPFSVSNSLEGERKRPESSFIAEPAASWQDDFFGWLNPVLESCCRVKIRDPTVFCSERDSEFDCQPCFLGREPAWNITLNGMPEGPEYMMYLRQWLKSPTNEECPLGGKAAYGAALSLRENQRPVEIMSPTPSPEDGALEVYASHFRTFHTPLRSQANFIDALAASERISEEISERTGVRVFAYSLFYVFFDQYLHLAYLAARTLGSAALAIFAITTFLLGSWRTGLVVTACVASALLGVAGAMGAWGISFNALTLVNLTVCAAICVEFCAHVARAFMRAPGGLPRSHPLSQKERDERALTALGDVGGSVLSGITGTKLVGISVLWFTQSEILKLYYAKMWFALIILGALHGLVLLPVLLSYYGGRGYSSAEAESEVRRRLLRAQESTEYRPFLSEALEDSEEEL